MALLGMAKPTRPASRRKKPEANPEGPYETLDGRGERPASRSEVTHFIDFIEHLQDEAERLLGLSGAQREMRIIAHLVRNHMAGRLVTMCSLASASGLSYGTAIRTIEAMFVQGLIVKRGRTATGRSQTLYPSPEFLTRWNSFAYRADQLVRAAAQLGSAAIFFEPQPSAFSRIIADTSSGAFIASLRRSLICGEASSIIPKPTSSFFEGVSSSCRQGTSLACRLTVASGGVGKQTSQVDDTTCPEAVRRHDLRQAIPEGHLHTGGIETSPSCH